MTGKPVSVSEEDRKFVPVNVTSIVSKASPAESAAASSASSPAVETGTIFVNSTPAGADVYADGNFVGNAPATLKLVSGKHSIRVSMSGYKDWSREMTVMSGSSVNLAAGLEKDGS